MRDSAGAVIVSLGLLAPICALAGNLVVGCVFDAASDCAQNLGYGVACSGVSGHGGGGGHGGATVTSTGTGGTGGTAGTGGTGGGCSLDTDCPMPAPGPCDPKPLCDNHVCTVKYAVGPLPIQRKGDCRQRVCDDMGKIAVQFDDSDTYDDGNDCTTDTCDQNHKPISTGTINVACNQNGGTFCVIGDPDAYCAECNPSVPGSCLGGKTCDNTGHCAPASCFDMVKNNAETATDCGGPACKKCPDTFMCIAGTDCYGGVCMGVPKTCQTANCGDGVKNPPESGVDCGGGVPCGACPDLQGCRRDADCLSKVCDNQICQAPTCMDGVSNGDESDVDCGGSCPACL